MKTNDGIKKRLESIFETKKKFHRDRAKLPFAEKIKIVVQLQQIARDVSLKKHQQSF